MHFLNIFGQLVKNQEGIIRPLLRFLNTDKTFYFKKERKL